MDLVTLTTALSSIGSFGGIVITTLKYIRKINKGIYNHIQHQEARLYEQDQRLIALSERIKAQQDRLDDIMNRLNSR
jgi:hypothetical protein